MRGILWDKGKVRYAFLQAMFHIFFLAVLGATFIINLGIFFFVALAVILVIIADHLWETRKVLLTEYSIRDSFIEILEKGKSIKIDYQKIQCIVIGNNIFERPFGVFSLSIETNNPAVGSTKKYCTIHTLAALDREAVYRLRNALIEKMGCSIDEKRPPLVSQFPPEILKNSVVFAFSLLRIAILLFVVILFQKDLVEYMLKLIDDYISVEITISLIFLGFLYDFYTAKKFYYNITDNMLIIRNEEIFAQGEIYMPFSSIKNVFLEEDIIDKFLSLGKIAIELKAEDFSDSIIIGLKREHAKMVSEKLKGLICQ